MEGIRLVIFIFIFIFIFISSISLIGSSAAAAASVCPRLEFAFLDSLRSQCPVGIERFPAVEVSGETLDRELSHGRSTGFYSVLFYATWCPFSRNVRPIFDALSSMFPTVRHLAVEESSAMPSVFSRYGIHSFPAILLVNSTATVRYHGSKDLSSLLHFYRETTGVEPVSIFAVDQPNNLGDVSSFGPWGGSFEEIVTNEPYLVFSILFIGLMIFVRFFHAIFPRLKAFWSSHVWQLNVGIFRESSHLLKQSLQLIDVKRLWSKLGLLNKARNFQTGAENARVWASSLASVSLGGSSSRLAARSS